ncbi:MAG: shikimate kinase [Synechococcales bacterium]|nr:shikimate kinase [Synechococcales bacterium]
MSDFPDNPNLKNINIYLVGMMGAGKSTVGRILAERMGYRFFDTDTLIEQAAQQSVAAIFAESGEAVFRQLETQVLSQLAAYQRLVVATGGGMVLSPKNWSFLHYGVVVWLDAPVDVLYVRLKEDTSRPLLNTPQPQETLQAILDVRSPLYQEADVRVPITAADAPEAIATHTLQAIQTVLKPEVLPPHLSDPSVTEQN